MMMMWHMAANSYCRQTAVLCFFLAFSNVW